MWSDAARSTKSLGVHLLATSILAAPARAVPFIPALDGVRALAVAAVLCYHAELGWAPGGFLGVEVFFVLSGYLITSLLWAEMRATGRANLAAFYLRRARRLLPAVVVLLVGVTTAFAAGWPSELGRIRGDVLAALGYSSNWYQVATDQGYFGELGRPSPFRHLWSLAIEEQFYLVWPAILVLLGRRRPLRMAVTAGALAAVSALLMWATFSVDDPTRSYLGTDTRAFGLLLGSALAFVWRPFAPGSRAERLRALRPRALDAIFVASLGVIAWYVARADELAAATFVPGIAVVAVATASLIAAAVHPATRAARAFGHPILQWLGQRSYGIYLWHWPVFAVTRPGADLDIGVEVALLLRIAITLPLAEASYRFVERPIRNGALGRLWRRADRQLRAGPQRWKVATSAGGAAMIATSWITGLTMLVGTAAAPRAPEVEVALRQAALDQAADARAGAATATAAAARARRGGVQQVVPIPPFEANVEAVGDSVMLGGRKALKTQIRGIWLNAATARRVSDGLDVLRTWRHAGTLAPIVVVHLGNNGMLTRASFERMMRLLEGVEHVLIVTVKVPRRWERSVNATLRDGARRYPQITLVDWHARWRGCRGGRVFAQDGYHLTPDGARCYADLIAASVPRRG